MGFNIPENMNIDGVEVDDFIPINKELCSQCGAECCDVSTPFNMEDIKRIKKKYKKLLRGVKLVPTQADAYSLQKRGNKQCVFLDKNKRCKIYEDRPQICRDFGDKPWARCAYCGLSAIPTDPGELRELARVAQLKSFETMARMAGHKNFNINQIDSRARNVLSDDFKVIGKNTGGR
jgi:Fe-S-cluster containining protein